MLINSERLLNWLGSKGVRKRLDAKILYQKLSKISISCMEVYFMAGNLFMLPKKSVELVVKVKKSD